MRVRLGSRPSLSFSTRREFGGSSSVSGRALEVTSAAISPRVLREQRLEGADHVGKANSRRFCASSRTSLRVSGWALARVSTASIAAGLFLARQHRRAHQAQQVAARTQELAEIREIGRRGFERALLSASSNTAVA